MNDVSKQALTKVPAVTLGFWVIKILATTLGETGGDTVTMTLNWGYVAGVALFGVALVVLIAAQILAKRFHATLYWADDRGLDNLRHDVGRFHRPIAARVKLLSGICAERGAYVVLGVALVLADGLLYRHPTNRQCGDLGAPRP
jgi:Repeat of Unknown Function (DUF347)